MATKAKTTTKKTRTAAAKPARVEKSEAVKTTVTTTSTSRTKDWFVKPVFAPKTPLGALFAELIGTFVFASIVLASKGSAIVVAFALVGIVLATSKLSGAHLNPALTFAAWTTRKISGWRATGYIVAQVLGAMLALLVANWMLPIQPADSTSFLGTAAPTVYHMPALTDSKEWYIFWAQMIGAGVLGFAVANLWNGRKNEDGGVGAALTVGFGLYAALVVGGSFAILNPAIAVAVSAVEWKIWPLAIYIFAPMVGAVAGAGLYKLFQADVEATEKA